MATDTVPAAVPMPPEPPNGTPAATNHTTPGRGFLASMVAAVEPARPTTFDLAPTPDTTTSDTPDGVLDRSTPGMSSASFRGTQDAAEKDPSGEKRKAQGSVWKAWWLAGAQRWAKGGGTANKRLDLHKARAQSHQVKEARTTTVNKSGGFPIRNSGSAGGGAKGIDRKPAPNSGGKGPVNASGNRSGGAGLGGSGGGAGRQSGGQKTPVVKQQPAAKHQGKGTPGAGGAGSAGGNSGTGASKGSGGHDTKTKTHGDKTSGKTPGTGSGTSTSAGGSGKQGSSGKNGTTGKDGHSGTTGSDGRRTADAQGQGQGQGDDTATRKGKKPGEQHDTRTPLEKSRETGHKDGSTVRDVVDHVMAYVDGGVDGWHDKKAQNAKEHARLDKAYDDRMTKTGRDQATTTADQEDDGVSTDIKPLTVKNIDANTLTLGTDATRPTIGRRELRNFKQYESKLEEKSTNLDKIAEACTLLEKEAENEARECQTLAEQAKSIEGGEKLLATLNRLTDAAKNQATEASELTRRAQRAAELCKSVLANIQTRYTPLYKAVVDSDEIKPAELRFYNDKGVYATAA
ncbi:hypothetical protein OV320_2669 [Actinobacteria bacterium OV320]|nr:hypothetical protein OV320_2669 [Actinobacteria bacterium OV320]